MSGAEMTELPEVERNPESEALNIENRDFSRDEEEDQVTKTIGPIGRYQFRIFSLVSLVHVFASWHMLTISFFTPGVKHWCKPPEDSGYRNWTLEMWQNYSTPKDEKHPEKYSSCLMYDRNYSIVPDDPYNVEEVNDTLKCKYGWEYDRSLFQQSLENEYDLVCQYEYLAKTGATSYMLGVLAGVVAFSQISDMFGRRNTLLISFATSLVSGVITAFMPTLPWFYLIRFFVAMGFAGLFTTGFVLIMELVDGKWRALLGIGIEIPWSIGYMLLALIAYFVPDWRNLQLAISVPVVILVIFFWFVPESIRWLISQGKMEQAESLARKAVKENKMDTVVRFKHVQQQTGVRRYYIWDLFRYPVLRWRTVNFYFNWFVNSFVYYGLSLGTNNLGGDLFITFFISGAIEIPAYLLSMWVLMKHGRRIPLCVTMVIGGVACLATAIFEKGVYTYDWPIVTLAMIGKFGISASFAIVYVYSAEIYPTVVRSIGVGTSSMCARIGSVSAPYVDLLRHIHPAIPLVIFGSCSVVAGLLILLIPETNNKPLPQSLKDAEEFGKK